MAFRIKDDELVEIEENKTWLSENRAKVLAGSLTLLAAILNLFGRWPKVMWGLVIL